MKTVYLLYEVCFFSVLKIPLGQACSQQDVCADDFATCQSGACRCMQDYYVKGDVCCKFKRLMISLFLQWAIRIYLVASEFLNAFMKGTFSLR